MENPIIKLLKTSDAKPATALSIPLSNKSVLKLTVECLAITDDGKGAFALTKKYHFFKNTDGEILENNQTVEAPVIYFGDGLSTATFSVGVIQERVTIQAHGEEDKVIKFKFKIHSHFLQL